MNNVPQSYDELLGALGSALGMTLSYKEDVCELMIEDRWTLLIRKDEQHGRVLLTGVLSADLPEDPSYAVIMEILDTAINPLLGAGPTIARDPESEMLVAYVMLDLVDIEPQDFVKAVEQFLEFQIIWSAKIAESGATETSKAGENTTTDMISA